MQLCLLLEDLTDVLTHVLEEFVRDIHMLLLTLLHPLLLLFIHPLISDRDSVQLLSHPQQLFLLSQLNIRLL